MVENMRGKIVDINSTMVILQSDEGQVAMPAKIFLEKMSLLYDQVDKNEA